jgi:hypothetical protein
MRATQARVAVLAVLGLVLAATAIAPAAAPAPRGELIPPVQLTWEAADPTAGLAGVVAWEQAAHDAEQLRRFYAELERQAEAARQAELERELAARLVAERADRGRRSAGGVWAALRQCENGGSYTSAAGDKYRGAYQFSPATWAGLGYSGDPAAAEPAVQDQAARELQARSGWGQWPRCARKLGLI